MIAAGSMPGPSLDESLRLWIMAMERQVQEAPANGAHLFSTGDCDSLAAVLRQARAALPHPR